MTTITETTTPTPTQRAVDNTNIESHLVEKRVFEPPKSFAKKAEIKSLAKYRQAVSQIDYESGEVLGERSGANSSGRRRGRKF